MSRLLVIAFAFVLVGCGPMGPVPGGKLSGTVQTIPDDRAAAREIQIIQIETRPDDP